MIAHLLAYVISDRRVIVGGKLVLRSARLVRIALLLVCLLGAGFGMTYGSGAWKLASIAAGMAVFVAMSFSQVVVDERGIEVHRFVVYRRLYPWSDLKGWHLTASGAWPERRSGRLVSLDELENRNFSAERRTAWVASVVEQIESYRPAAME